MFAAGLCIRDADFSNAESFSLFILETVFKPKEFEMSK